MSRSFRRSLAGLLLAGGVVLLVLSIWLPRQIEVAIPIRSEAALAAGLPERVILTVPASLRLGEAANVTLHLPGGEAPGLPSSAQAEARLELTGVDIEPGSRLVQIVSPGRPVTFTWQVRPFEAGKSEGMLWFYWTGGEGNSEARLPVLARPVELEVSGFLGWPVWVGQLTALLLAAAGGVLWRSGARRSGRASR